MSYMEAYHPWREKLSENGELYAELCAIEGNEREIEDRFYRELEFGTGGLRGVLGGSRNQPHECLHSGKGYLGLQQLINLDGGPSPCGHRL